MIALTAEQVCRVVREAQPSNATFHGMVDKLVYEHPHAMAFGVTEMVCSFCGREQRTVHPIPIKFPAECHKCGRMTCYERVE